MKKWPGIDDFTSSVGEETLRTATNVSFTVAGEIRKRAGFGNKLTQSGVVVKEMLDPLLGVYVGIFVTSTGSIVSATL